MSDVVARSLTFNRFSPAALRSILLQDARVVILAMALAVAGCSTPVPSKHYTRDRHELIAAFKAESDAVREQRAAREQASIRLLDAREEADGAPAGFRVSADLEGAQVVTVVNRLLRDTGVDYNLGDVTLSGSITARFTDLDLPVALNEILSAQGISVAWRGGLLVFRYGASDQYNGTNGGSDTSFVGDDSDSTGGNVQTEVDLRYMSAADAIALLERMYKDGDTLSYGTVPDLNAVDLSGNAQTVASARTVLARADRAVPHVFIETLVADLDTLATQSLGARLTDGASGDFSGINILPNSSTGTLAFSLIKGLQSPDQLNLMIDMLVSEDSAEVLSRPYIATRSNQEAKISIVTDQYVAVQRSVEGAALTTAEGISAGVKLNVTPVVQADGMIRLDISVEQSQFVPAAAGSLVQLERNTATTSVTVESGRTIAIGGLKSSNRAVTNSGIPILRHIPILGLATGSNNEQRVGRELVVYITPRVWDPQVDVPLIRPDLPTQKQAQSFDSLKHEEHEPDQSQR